MVDLAQRLRNDTQTWHLKAERSGYVNDILKRRATKEGYALMLRNLLPAYRAMEQALTSHASEPGFDKFDWPPLARSAALAADLDALEGLAWASTLDVLPEGHRYAERISHVAGTAPLRLIGHAYVRYVGDLSGGQILQRLLSTSPGLSPDMLNLYDFAMIDDVDAFKTGFRQGLIDLGEAMDGADEVVDEAIRAFRLNVDLSVALKEALKGTQQGK